MVIIVKKKVVFIVLFLVLIMFGSVLYFLYFRDDFEIKINGPEEVTIIINEEYKDEGATVTNRGKPYKDYKTINNVNTNELGTYEVIYKIKDIEKKRIVKVIDNIPPEVKLIKKNYYIRNSKKKLEDYIEVTDNYDKENINIKVEGNYNLTKVGLYNVKYVVTDSNNNEQTLETTINVQDKNTSGVPVLMYHWFYDDTKGEKAGSPNTNNYLSKTNFEKQLKYLKDNNYYYPTWQELIDYIDKKIDLPKKSVILTSDDCKGSFFTVALPVAQKYQIPITSFCITEKTHWQKYKGEEYLDFESHTDGLHHRICKGSWDGAVMCKDYNTIYNDIKLSVEKVENTWAFAYPFGHYNNNTIKALKANNIKLAFTINNGRVKKGSNKYKLPRVRISKTTSLETFKGLVK